MRISEERFKMSSEYKQDCMRCGGCCMEAGLMFWKVEYCLGEFEKSGFLCELADGFPSDGQNGRAYDALPCMMLRMKDGVATCLIEKHFGRESKPSVCREYEPDDSCPRAPQELVADASTTCGSGPAPVPPDGNVKGVTINKRNEAALAR